jgi:hypothetical protein
MADQSQQNIKLGIYKTASEACAEWAAEWGLALSFAITQSMEDAEQTLAEAIVAQMAAKAQSAATDASDYMVDFAKKIWTQANTRATNRSLVHDDFFRLAPAIRAAVMLKIKGKFSRRQIALVMATNEASVEKMLEAARLAFSKGKPWLINGTFRRQLDDAKLVAPCPNPQDGRLYARYLESDLPTTEILALHKHFVSCTPCRANLLQFKNMYSDWLFVLPEPEITKATRGYIRKMINMGRQASAQARKETGPRFWPGFKKTLLERETQILIGVFVLFMALLQYFRNS